MLKRERPLFFVLIDNLRFDQWRAISPIFAESFRILEEDSFYSILPTATTIRAQRHLQRITSYRY